MQLYFQSVRYGVQIDEGLSRTDLRECLVVMVVVVIDAGVDRRGVVQGHLGAGS